MRATQPLTPRFRKMPTLDELSTPTEAELPATDGIEQQTIEAAIKLSSARHAVRRFVDAARYAKRIQAELARQRASEPPRDIGTSLKAALHRLFMEAMSYFHEHLDAPMPAQLRGALARLHRAIHGARVEVNVLFVDLKLLVASEAGRAPSVLRAADEAEQALISLRLG